MSWLDGIGDALKVGNEVANVYESYAQARLGNMQADAQKSANKAQAQVARNNAWLAERQASDALYRGVVEENHTRVKTAMLKSTQRARFAAGNITLDGPSVSRILTDTDYLGAVDAQTNRENAAREAWAYRAQAMDSVTRAEILDHAVVPVPESGSSAILGSLLGSAGRVAASWKDRI